MTVFADELLHKLGISTPPIDPISISQQLGFKVSVQPKPLLFEMNNIYLNPELRDAKKRFWCAKAIYHILKKDDPRSLNTLKDAA